MSGIIEGLLFCVKLSLFCVKILYFTQWEKSPKKQSVGVCIFDNMALFLSAELTKNAFLQTVFLAVLPTGYFL